MIILRQQNYSALGTLGGISGFIAGAKLGSKIPIKRKLKKWELNDQKEAIKEYKNIIKIAKSESGFTNKFAKKDFYNQPYWHSDDLLSKYGVSDNPDEIDHELLNKHKKEIIEESERRIKQHEDILKNPEKYKKNSSISSLLGGTLGAVGGAILGSHLNDKLKKKKIKR